MTQGYLLRPNYNRIFITVENQELLVESTMKIVGMDSKSLIITICEMIFTKTDKGSLPMVKKNFT
jgi:hypothetical protein